MRDGFRRGFAVGLLMVAGVAFGQTAAGNSGHAAAGKLAFVSATVKPSAPWTIDSQRADSAKLLADIKSGKIKLHPGESISTERKFGAHVDTSQAEYDNVSLKLLIANAYNMKAYQISGPEWLDDKLFDIVAKMPGGASIDDAPKMLQALLEDRFKLTVHRENKNQQVMALVVAKGGPKLQPATADLQPVTGTPLFPPVNMTVATPNGQVRFTITTINGQRDETVESNKMTMAGLADLLTNLFQGGGGGGQWQKVVDQTGLTGEYQVSFNTSMFFLIFQSRILGVPADTGGGVISNDMLQVAAAEQEQQHPNYIASPTITNPLDPIVFESIQKLGLKLEISKAPIEMLVVDHADKNPTAN